MSVLSINSFGQLDLELDSDDNHVITYEVEQDTIKIEIEVLNDFSLDLDADGSLGEEDDFIFLMLDRNSNSAIDLGSSTDLYFTYDSSDSRGICSGHILTPQNRSVCSSSGARAKAILETTALTNIPHLVYYFYIPTQELEFSGIEALCGQISIKVHSAGTEIEESITFPKQKDSALYFVAPSNTMNLFPDVKIVLPSGEVAPANSIVSVCIGDRLELKSVYPQDKYEWFDENTPDATFSQNTYALVKNFSTSYYFVELKGVNSSLCYYSDTVFVNLQDESICKGAYKFPNVVTPNNDGINDVFELILGAEDLDDWKWNDSRLKIYNRWGLAVYKSSKDLSGRPMWDCREETGKYVVSGTYFYSFTKPNNSGVINGFFTVFSDR
jgi:gliding motility-associated-like protein